VYEAAGLPRYQLAADGYPETLDVNGKMLIGFGGSADRYENWLTKAQPNLSVEGLPTDLRTEILGKGYLALPVDRDKDMGFFLRGQAQGRSAAVHTAGDIPLSVYASNQRVWRLFNGTTENTEVFFRIMRAVTGNY
jgi:alkaline phosphatase